LKTDPEMVQRYRVKLHKLFKTLGQKKWANRALDAPDVMHLNVLAGVAYRKMIETRPEQQKRIKLLFELQGFEVTQAPEEVQTDIKDQIMNNAKLN